MSRRREDRCFSCPVTLLTAFRNSSGFCHTIAVNVYFHEYVGTVAASVSTNFAPSPEFDINSKSEIIISQTFFICNVMQFLLLVQWVCANRIDNSDHWSNTQLNSVTQLRLIIADQQQINGSHCASNKSHNVSLNQTHCSALICFCLRIDFS